VPLVLEGSQAVARGAAVTDEAGSPIGEVTSAAPSPMIGRSVALAMLKRAYAEVGKDVVVGGVRAKVVELPA
jgi:aminomethyltransferase